MALGNGTPGQAAQLKQVQNLPFDLLTDPSRASYHAAGLRASPLASLSPQLLRNSVRAWRQGFRQGRVQGSAWQQGGVLVFDAGGEVLARYESRTGGDHPSTQWILDALAKVAP